MSDLDKLMNKLNKGKEKEKKKVEEKPVEEPSEELDDEDLDDEDLNDEEETSEDTEKGDPIPANEGDQTVAGEVGVLQNNGIFRRELLLTLKEKNDILKVIAQTLIELKKKFDEADGTEKSK